MKEKFSIFSVFFATCAGGRSDRPSACKIFPSTSRKFPSFGKNCLPNRLQQNTNSPKAAANYSDKFSQQGQHSDKHQQNQRTEGRKIQHGSQSDTADKPTARHAIRFHDEKTKQKGQQRKEERSIKQCRSHSPCAAIGVKGPAGRAAQII